MQKLMQLSKIAAVSAVLCLVLASCDPNGTILGGNGGGGGVVPGSIAFNHNTVSLGYGQETDVTLQLSNSSGVNNVPVNIQLQGDIVTVSKSSCVLSSSPANAQSCEFDITARNDSGTTTITATAPGYTITPITVTVTSTPVTKPGTLEFIGEQSSVVESSVTITQGSIVHVRAKLDGSVGESNVTVGLSSLNTNIASIESPEGATCILGSGSAYNKCTVVLSAVSTTNGASTTIIASSAINESAYLNAIISENTQWGTISFYPKSLVNPIPVGEPVSENLILESSSGVSSQTVTFTPTNSDVTLSKNTCQLSTASPSCSFTITGKSDGTTAINVNPIDHYTIEPLPVTVSSKGTLEFFNNAGTQINMTSMYINESGEVQLILESSYDITEPVPVTITTTPGAYFTESPTSCALTTASNSCTITLNNSGIVESNDYLSASATGYNTESIPVYVTDKPSLGYISFNPASENVAVGSSIAANLYWNGSRGLMESTIVVYFVNKAPNFVTESPESCIVNEDSYCTINVQGQAAGDANSITATGIYGGESALAPSVLYVNVTPPAPPPPYIPNSRFGVINYCPVTVWVQTEQNGSEESNVELLSGESFDYQVESATQLTGLQIWPKLGCNTNGENCAIGQEYPDGSGCLAQGCQPHFDSTLNISFFSQSNGGDFNYGTDLINGYTLPYSVVVYPGTGENSPTCLSVESTANLSMSSCPTAASLTTPGLESLGPDAFGPYESYTLVLPPYHVENLTSVSELYSANGAYESACLSPMTVLGDVGFGALGLSQNESAYAQNLNDPVLMYACPFQQGGLGDLSSYESTNAGVWPINFWGDGLQKMSNLCHLLGSCDEGNEPIEAAQICDDVGPVSDTAYVNYVHTVVPNIPAYPYDYHNSNNQVGVHQFQCNSVATQVVFELCPNNK